jgi:hypothetical protein
VIAVNFERKHGAKIIREIIFPQSGNGDPIYNPDGLYLVKLHWNGKEQQRGRMDEDEERRGRTRGSEKMRKDEGGREG